MGNSPQLSVIMSVYNNEEYISKAIESILNQTFIDFEFIIIDDCSNDNSLELISCYEKIDNRIIVIKNKINIGLTDSLNKGLNIARGKYIARQDSDDISHIERLKMQIDYMESNPNIHLLGSNCTKIDIDGNCVYDDCFYSTIKDIKHVLLKQSAIFPHGVAFMKKETINKLGNYNNNFYYTQDAELWLRFIDNNYSIKVLQEILYYFRFTPLKNNKKAFGQYKYSQLLGEYYNGTPDISKAQFNERSKQIKKIIQITNFPIKKNYMSQYWYKMAKAAIKYNKKNLNYICKSIKNSYRYSDSIFNYVKKIIVLILLLLLPQRIIKIYKKIE